MLSEMAAAFFADILQKEVIFVLGSERARRLRENPDKVIFKYKLDGTPFSLEVLLPQEPNLVQLITERVNLLRERVDAEPYATTYPERKRALALAKMFIIVPEHPDGEVQITFLPCTLSHFNHFFERIPYRDWLDNIA